jgi:hypothetical protein
LIYFLDFATCISPVKIFDFLLYHKNYIQTHAYNINYLKEGGAKNAGGEKNAGGPKNAGGAKNDGPAG